MRAGLERFVSECAADRNFARLLLVESIGVSPAISEIRDRLQDSFARMIEAEARASALADHFYEHVDPALFARALVGAAEESAAHMLETGPVETRRLVTGLSAIFIPGSTSVASAVDGIVGTADQLEPSVRGAVAP